MTSFGHAVVGAGIHGLCTAFWLWQLGARSIVVLDRHAPAHTLGSSHGATRILRTSYHEPAFVRLAAEALATGWPAVERACGRRLRVATPGVFFGPANGPFGAYLRAATTVRAQIEAVAVDEARRRFPLIRFDDDDAVLLDHTAAMLLAADTMQALRDWLAAAGVELLWRTRVLDVAPSACGVVVQTTAGAMQVGSLVLATGPWQLGPAPQEPLTVLRQEVGYFALLSPPATLEAGAFPVWAHIGRDAADFDYGLPSHHGQGVKLARHRTEGPPDDPDGTPGVIDAEALRALAGQRLRVAATLTATEHCLYSMTQDQGLRVQRSTACPSIITVAACSGHGFKFGPVIGRMAAQLAVVS